TGVIARNEESILKHNMGDVNMTDVVIIDGVRTAIGRFGGAFKDTPARELAGAVIRHVLSRANLTGSQVDEVIIGCVGQIGDDAYIGRTASLEAGLPTSTTAYTVNRLCGSGLQAILTAAA